MAKHSKPSHSDIASNEQIEQGRIMASRRKLRDKQEFVETPEQKREREARLREAGK
jgi:hypothetical protein